MAGKPTYEELEQRVKELDAEVDRAEVDRHHQLEKNLRETEARFLAFMDNLPAVAYIKNESGQHIYGNKTLFDKFGMSPDKFIGTTTRDIFPPYEAEKIEAYDKVVKTEGVAVETDDWPDKFQGQARWWKEIKFPIKLPSGRKQREEKMQMMQFAMDHAMDRIAWIAPDGRFLYANEAACKEMEYTREEVLSRRVSDINPVESWAEHYQEVKKRGSMRLETQQVAGDGKIHDMEVFTNILEFGDREFMCSFGRDITKRRRAEEGLKASEQKYRSLTDNLNVGVFRNTAGSKGRFIEVNPTFLKMFGYESRDELFSVTVSDMYKDSKKREAFNEKMLKEGYVKDEENVYMRKDGTTFTGAVSAVAVRDNDGRVSYYDGIVEDITKRKEVEKALQESQEDLQRLAGKLISTQEAERRLLAREMHDDISQRLAILAIDAGKLERLCKDSANPIVETLQDMKNRLVGLSSDIHAISRQLHPSILDDLGLFDAVKAECEGFSSREGITVKYAPKAIPSQLPRDAALTLFRIVQEGLRNVAKHAQTQNVNVSLFGMDNSVHLSISDDGVGFDYSEARTKPGLGLASMEERARLIQGEISIKSELGKGTVIEVKAPLEAEQKPRP
jgi:PAS domain S-box-containing protein